MKEKQNEINKRIEGLLNERWHITNMKDSRPQDMSYYYGALKMLEFTGYAWLRYENGEHRVWRSK